MKEQTIKLKDLVTVKKDQHTEAYNYRVTLKGSIAASEKEDEPLRTIAEMAIQAATHSIMKLDTVQYALRYKNLVYQDAYQEILESIGRCSTMGDFIDLVVFSKEELKRMEKEEREGEDL